jgi:CheY-like chemotaxis protein
MKKLLIHSNNTSFNNTELFPLTEQFVFDVDFDKDVDFYINENLTDGGLQQKLEKCDIVFIKVSLSKNYLEYLGLRLAYHIRLTKGLGNKAYLPIVFIAEESFQYLGLTYSEPSILFTKGIYLIKESFDDYQKTLKWFNNGRIKPLDDFTFFVNSISINPPSNYQSHHSVANEWALARYFSMFERDESNEFYNSLREKILNLDYLKTLHFKYTEAKATRQKFNPKKKHAYSPLIGGIENVKIGIIDDEINKGWLDFYEYVFNKSKAQSFPFEDFRKDESRNELIERIQNWLLDCFKSTEPIDVFIVDIRLHDDDFSEQDFDNLSGVQLIKFIKSQNPGIQIVVSTASNKVWNFQKCLEYGVSYYSIKESPETYSTREETRNTLVHLNRQIADAKQKSYLADLYRSNKYLKKNVNENNNIDKEFSKLTFEKNGLIDQIYNLLLIDYRNESIINQCLLISFHILENYCDLNSVGIWDFKKSGKVILKNGHLLNVFTVMNQNDVMSRLHLIKGRLFFQNNNFETVKSFQVYDEELLSTIYSNSIDSTTIVKLISVLHFRHNIDFSEIERVIELRYYRSNVAAHLTGNVKPDYKIQSVDILFLNSLFFKIFS